MARTAASSPPTPRTTGASAPGIFTGLSRSPVCAPPGPTAVMQMPGGGADLSESATAAGRGDGAHGRVIAADSAHDRRVGAEDLHRVGAQPRRHGAGPDGVDGDALVGVVDGELLREPDHAVLGG